ncbi:MAG: copper amine oxidase N-terminal domain-containing protein [Bacillota bacterium]|nr:copper amine oxidase N-terminal domain-containing protein [Bacillota bacterium]
MKKLISLLFLCMALLFGFCGQAMASESSSPFFIIDTDTGQWNSYDAKWSNNPNIPQMDVPPVVQKGRLLVPIRWFADVVKFQTSWDPASQEITLSGSRVIKMTVGSNQATVDGKPIVLDVPPQIISGRTMVPLRFISEAFGYQVYYNPDYGIRNGGRPEVWVTYYTVLTAEEHRKLYEPDTTNFELVGPRYNDGGGLNIYHLKANGETPRHNRLGDSLIQVLSMQGIPRSVYTGEEWVEFYRIKNLPPDWSGKIMYEDCFNSFGAGSEFYYHFIFTKGVLTEVEICV